MFNKEEKERYDQALRACSDLTWHFNHDKNKVSDYMLDELMRLDEEIADMEYDRRHPES